MSTEYKSYLSDICRNCENNCGGACCYDLEEEAKEKNVPLDKIRHDDYCAYYDRRGADD